MGTDRYVCLPLYTFILYRVCSSKFPSSHTVCCLFHVQGAILTTMLATRNFSSKYDGHGKYLRTPRTKQNDRNSLFWYGLVTALYQKLVFLLFTMFMLKLYPVTCFIPEHASLYTFWSDNFTVYCAA
jgi:hypothetical protein